MTEPPAIAVRGEAVLEVPPDVARIEVSVAASESDQATTLRVLSERASAVDKVLASFPEAIQKIETSGGRVSPRLASRATGASGPGYHGAVYHAVTVAALGRLGELMAQLAEQEQVEVGGPWWELLPGSAVYAEVRVAAVRDAVRRARDYAAALGSELTGLVELADTRLTDSRLSADVAAQPVARLPHRVRVTAPEDLSADLRPATQVVRAAVEARFTIAQPDLANA